MSGEDFEPGDIVAAKEGQKINLPEGLTRFGDGYVVASTDSKCDWPTGPCAAEDADSTEEADECCRICSGRASQKISLGEPLLGTDLFRSQTPEYPAAAFTLIRKAGSYQLVSKAEI
jgi:hypothetical protein